MPTGVSGCEKSTPEGTTAEDAIVSPMCFPWSGEPGCDLCSFGGNGGAAAPSASTGCHVLRPMLQTLRILSATASSVHIFNTGNTSFFGTPGRMPRCETRRTRFAWFDRKKLPHFAAVVVPVSDSVSGRRSLMSPAVASNMSPRIQTRTFKECPLKVSRYRPLIDAVTNRDARPDRPRITESRVAKADPFSTATAESAVNQVLNQRMCKRQQMRAGRRSESICLRRSDAR